MHQRTPQDEIRNHLGGSARVATRRLASALWRFKGQLDVGFGFGPFSEGPGPELPGLFRLVLDELEPLTAEPMLAELHRRGEECARRLLGAEKESAAGDTYAWVADLFDLIPEELALQEEDVSSAFSDGWGEAAEHAVHGALRQMEVAAADPAAGWFSAPVMISLMDGHQAGFPGKRVAVLSFQGKAHGSLAGVLEESSGTFRVTCEPTLNMPSRILRNDEWSPVSGFHLEFHRSPEGFASGSLRVEAAGLSGEGHFQNLPILVHGPHGLAEHPSGDPLRPPPARLSLTWSDGSILLAE
ncbi:MAG: hypothetical protein AB1758_27215 [Candidatus Eremiobacterota bacterium]